MSKRYDHILDYVNSQPWMIDPTHGSVAAVKAILAARMAGEVWTEEEIRERVTMAQRDQGERRGRRNQGGVAVIPIYGLLTPRADLMSEMSGATSMEAIRRDVRTALADEEVATILLDVDSPGGLAEGVPETAAELRRARDQKPVVAVANTYMASAAYYLASQASEVVASPSAYVGSVGVLSYHQDYSAAYEQKGIKTTIIRAGKYKAEANEFEPLSDEALTHSQEIIDGLYEMFFSDVAKGRGVRKPASDGSAFGGGRVFLPGPAMEAGLVDRIATLDETIARVLKSPPATGRAKALAFDTNIEAPGDLAAEAREAIIAGIRALDDAPEPAFEFERELYTRRAK
jgi:signal peptide peptidase SppA